MPLEGLSFWKTLATFGIVNATDSLIQDITSILGYFNLKSLETMQIYARHFSTSFPLQFIIFSFLKQVIHYLSAV